MTTNPIVLSYIPIQKVYILYNVNYASGSTTESNSKLVENTTDYQKINENDNSVSYRKGMMFHLIEVTWRLCAQITGT